ncbi:MAG: M56 family metallopeptidase [Acidobacteriia bacterium]|nr:M56 family metallopeptidase [Terriglobia bacterium]
MTTAMAQALSAALLHFVWQGLLVAFLLWVALFGLRKRSANSRYLASCMALAVLAVLPAITAYVLYTGPAPARAGLVLNAIVPQGVAAAARGAVPARDWLAAWQSWAVPAWSLGVLLFSIRLAWGCRQVSSLRRRGSPAEAPVVAIVATLGARLGLARPVRVLMTAVADGPSVVGWIRPAILLPSATFLGLTPEQLEAVLAHELAHIRRHDYLVNVLQILAETLLFYHPAVWWISARIRRERELCCDDLAVSSCGDALCYARALTKIERLRMMAPGMAMASTGGPLLYRIQRLIGVKTQECGPSKLPGILALCLGLACFAINVHWARGQAQEEPKTAFSFTVRGPGQGRDGAGVSVDLGTAAVLHRTSVEYPWPAIEKGIEGTVTVEATLDAAGAVGDARVLSGPLELRRAALQSVFEWHFLPDVAGSTRQVSVNFQLAAARRRQAEEAAGTVDDLHKEQLEQVKVFMNDLAQSREEKEQLERRLVERREELDRLQGALARQQDPAVLNELKGRLNELRTMTQELEQQRAALAESNSPSGNRRLVRIDAVGLSDQVREALFSRLTVHLGDTLSPESMESIGAAIRKFDEHFEWKWLQLEDGQVALRIIAPNSGRVFLFRQ